MIDCRRRGQVAQSRDDRRQLTSTITGSTVWTFFQFQQDLVTPAGDTGFLPTT
jgi:hypothetical protein